MKKNIRKSLIEKYLNAETDVREEQMLAEWFAANGAEQDEEAVARLILSEYPEAGYDAAEKEYDSIMDTHLRRRRIFIMAGGIAACIAVAMGLFLSQRRACPFDGLEMAQGIDQIMSLDTDNVESVTAKPKGSKVIITAQMKDGSTCSYIMRKDEDASTISITAMSNNSK
jgi:hypothetical protein